MKKNFYNKPIIITIFLLLAIGGAFYWFAYRPAQIRSKCSWVEKVIPAKPVQPAITKEKADVSQREYDKCAKEVIRKTGNQFMALSCKEILREGPEIPAQPERVEYKKATKEQYDFCIREHGLWR